MRDTQDQAMEPDLVGAVPHRVGLVAYHFPPVQGSSGVQRTLAAARYLPDFGWQPRVLTVRTAAYPATHPGQLHEVPEAVAVARLPAFDTARHFAIAGRYPAWLASPDRYISWAWFGFPTARRFLARHPVDVILSTYPIATAHILGGRLARSLKLPWVADFRDLMVDDGYPSLPSARRVSLRVEATTIREASRILVTTRGAREILLGRYRSLSPERVIVLENGFDEDNFRVAEARARPTFPGKPPILLHSGVMYPTERNPTALFGAVAQLKSEGFFARWPFEIVLRASGHDRELAAELERHDIADRVQLAPPLGYVEALVEMLEADALLIMQGPDCNHQIPAKLYEYLRAGRPILGLTDAAGDTAALLRKYAIPSIADMMDREAIAAQLRTLVPALHRAELRGAEPQAVAEASRYARCRALASVLDALRSAAR